MKAAVVRKFGDPPVYDDFPDPIAGPDETVVSLSAAAVSQLTRGRASGAHYSASGMLPLVPGVDGVGRADDGRMVYVAFTRPPLGTLAERTVVSRDHLVELPAGLDPVVAAGAANPGMSCWIPLTQLATVRRDEAVLVNGATGTAGRMAVQVAKHLGASKVIATGRDEGKLRSLVELGADTVLSVLGPRETFRDAVRKEAREARIGIVLDYLWGPSAEAILSALGGPNAPRGSARVRYVEVGGLAERTITLPSEVLRSSGVEILGTGLGGVSDRDLLAGIGQFLQALAQARFRIDLEVRPLSEVQTAWQSSDPAKRLVFTIP